MLNRRVLLLNQNYEPLSVCRARRALALVLLRKAETVELTGILARSVSLSIPVPSVLRLNYYIRTNHKDVPLTKRNVLRRDDSTCQYCGKRGPEMTTDHVVPRSKGGAHAWDNLVCACSDCNARKGDRTPRQAKLRLTRRPKKPHYFTFTISSLGEVPASWRQYLFQS